MVGMLEGGRMEKLVKRIPKVGKYSLKILLKYSKEISLEILPPPPIPWFGGEAHRQGGEVASAEQEDVEEEAEQAGRVEGGCCQVRYCAVARAGADGDN